MTLLALYGKRDAEPWLRESCGRYLSSLLLREHGISSLMTVFLAKAGSSAGYIIDQNLTF